MRYWGCWRLKPRDPSISPCGDDQKGTDPACKGCADDPRKHIQQEIEGRFSATQKAWARNMERARKQLRRKDKVQ